MTIDVPDGCVAVVFEREVLDGLAARLNQSQVRSYDDRYVITFSVAKTDVPGLVALSEAWQLIVKAAQLEKVPAATGRTDPPPSDGDRACRCGAPWGTEHHPDCYQGRAEVALDTEGRFSSAGGLSISKGGKDDIDRCDA